MRLLLRVHEWLADHTRLVQYPAPARYVPRFQPNRRPGLAYRWRVMPPKRRAWVYFALFWGSVIALSIYGNLID